MMATVVAVACACTFTTIIIYYILICSYGFVDFIFHVIFCSVFKCPYLQAVTNTEIYLVGQHVVVFL